MRIAGVWRIRARLSFWWSHVEFGGRGAFSPLSHKGRGEKNKRVCDSLSLFLVLLPACLLFLAQLQAPLLEPQEPRYAEIAREMVVDNDWLTPRLHGSPYLDKPPLLYWLTAASYALFGVHDWSARLVPGLTGILTVLTTWLWGRATVGPACAFWGGLILCLSARFVYLARLLTFDGLLCLCVTAALAAAHLALTGPRFRWSWWVLSAGACGLGLLAKGPVALALVLPPLLAFVLLDERSPRLTVVAMAGYLGLAALLAAPWYGTMILLYPEFAGYFFWTHNVVRFLTPFDHAEPAWFHLPGLLLGLLPWSLLLPGLLRFLWRRGACSAARRPAALGLFLLAWTWGLLFFSMSGCKRASYVLPVIPPLALALGCYLARLAPAWPGRRLLPRSARLPGWANALILVLGLGIVVVAWNNRLLGLPPAGLATAVIVGLLAGLRFAPLRSWPAVAGLTFGLLLGGVQFLLPAYNAQFALRQQLSARAEEVRQGRVPVICTPQGWDSVRFYLPDAEVKVFSTRQRAELLLELQAHPKALLLVKSGRLFDELRQELPGGVELIAQNPQGPVTAVWVRNGTKAGERRAEALRSQRR